MRKSDLVKLVISIILTVCAIVCCVVAVSMRFSLEETMKNAEGEQVIGLIFGAPFILIIAVLFAFAGMIADLVSILLCALGLRSPIGWMKITFLLLIILNFALALTTGFGTFWNLG